MDVLIELPVELKALLTIAVIVIVTEILKVLGAKLGIDLSGYTAKVTASVVGSILVLINGVLSNVPVQIAPIVQSLLGLVVVVLASFGAYKTFLGNKSKG